MVQGRVQTPADFEIAEASVVVERDHGPLTPGEHSRVLPCHRPTLLELSPLRGRPDLFPSFVAKRLVRVDAPGVPEQTSVFPEVIQMT